MNRPMLIALLIFSLLALVFLGLILLPAVASADPNQSRSKPGWR